MQTPLLRDTATVNLKSYIVLRFVAANPGTWMFHCATSLIGFQAGFDVRAAFHGICFVPVYPPGTRFFHCSLYGQGLGRCA